MYVWIAKGPLMQGNKTLATEGTVLEDGVLSESRIKYMLEHGKLEKYQPPQRKKRSKKKKIKEEVKDETS